MKTQMTDHIQSAKSIAADRLAEAGAGSLALFLRECDPDAGWPKSTADLRDHAQDIAHEGIVGDGPEACACFASVMLATADDDAIVSFAQSFDIDDTGGITDRLMDLVHVTITDGLIDGAIDPSAVLDLLRAAS
jgi:hypothetical protein